MTSEYRVDIKVRNNVILYKIEQAGYDSIGEFCRLNKMPGKNSILGDIVNMKESPLNKKGEFRPVIQEVAEILKCDPLDLFSDAQLHTILKSNKRSIQVNEAEMKFMLDKENNQKLLEDSILEDQMNNAVEKQLHSLSPREENVLNMEFGRYPYTKEYTLREIGIKLELSPERIRQIREKALRKLRHPDRAGLLREYIEDFQ